MGRRKEFKLGSPSSTRSQGLRFSARQVAAALERQLNNQALQNQKPHFQPPYSSPGRGVNGESSN